MTFRRRIPCYLIQKSYREALLLSGSCGMVYSIAISATHTAFVVCSSPTNLHAWMTVFRYPILKSLILSFYLE